MGATGTYRPPGISHRQFFEQQWGRGNLEILDQHTDGNIIYFACRYKPKGYVIPIIVETHRHPRSRDDIKYTYRETEESQGPITSQRRCSDRILDQLSPLEEIYGDGGHTAAQAWRDECRAYNARVKALPKAKRGDTIRFTPAIEFADGAIHEDLVLVKGATFTVPGQSWRHYRIERMWRRERRWVVVDLEAEAVARAEAERVSELAAGLPTPEVALLAQAANAAGATPASLALDDVDLRRAIA